MYIHSSLAFVFSLTAVQTPGDCVDYKALLRDKFVWTFDLLIFFLRLMRD